MDECPICTSGHPLDTIGDQYLFTAHMLQHLLLTLVAAPLLLGGTPAWLLRQVLAALRLTRFVRWARHPIVAFFTFNIVFSLAHVPSFYELTLSNEVLHAVEHLVFVGTAMLMWMPVLSPAPDIAERYPALGQVMYLFLQTVPASLLGFTDRGTIHAGGWADIMIFDPETIGPWKKEFVHDLPGGVGRFKAWGKGVKATIVNGQPIVLDGQLTGRLPGAFVSPTR